MKPSFILICLFIYLLLGLFISFFFRATSTAYGSSQARILLGIRAAAAGLRYSYSNSRSEPHLQPAPQLVATPDP